MPKRAAGHLVVLGEQTAPMVLSMREADHVADLRLGGNQGWTGSLEEATLLGEREYEIKGIGWGFKTIGKYHPELLTKFLNSAVKGTHSTKLMLKKATRYLSNSHKAATGEAAMTSVHDQAVTYVPYQPKRILNVHKHVDGGWFWTKYGAHPYVGCEEGCAYCYWRDEKYNMLARDPAARHLSDPFSQYIKIKTNAPELLRKELSRAEKDVIMVGDYQPAEGKYGLSREMLKVCAELGFPTMVLEKSPLVLKDLDVISEINRRAWACVMFSIVRGDSRGYGEIFEPNAPRIGGRFHAMRKIADAGILTGTAFMPILPFVCDDDSNLEAVVKRTAESGGKFVLAAGLTMSGAQARYFIEALKKHDPVLVEKYDALYKGAYSPLDTKYFGRIGLKVRELCAKYGISDRMPRHIPDSPLAANKHVAEEVFAKCHLLELESAPSFKVWAYRRAGWTIDELDQDIVTIYRKRGLDGLKALPNIGPSIATFIAEKLSGT